MKYLFILVFSLLSTSLCFSQDVYNYEIDLLNIEKDRVQVSLTPPAIAEDEIIFVIPSVIPGSYSKKDFAQFIQNFKVYDETGSKLKYKLVDKSYFLISNAQNIGKIEYLVNDTWDETKKKKYIFEPGGTNIAPPSNIVLNNHGFFGYFEGYKDLDFEITVKKPANFYASSYLKKEMIDAETDKLFAANYFTLSDNPVLYCEPDTTSFKISNTTIKISVFNEDKSTTSKDIALLLQPLGKALERFFEGKLPTDEYWFIIYLEELDNMKKSGGYGALEHHHSSFYFLPETKMKDKFNQMILDISAHEFLHILTPLNLHSTYIADFDFRQPTMSQHLWLYEGVTEYFSLLAQLQDSLITTKYFISEMSEKISTSQGYPNFSMISMSENVLDAPFTDWYQSVYSRGAVLAFMLDLKILEASNGKQNLKDVLLLLTAKYGSENPFKDDELFDEIIALTDPSIATFIDTYLVDTAEPLYEEFLQTIGWDYKKKHSEEIFYLGNIGLKYDENSEQFVFINGPNNAFGVSKGDVLLSVNDVKISVDNVNQLYEEYFQGRATDEQVKIEVIQLGQQYVRIGTPLKATKQSENYIEYGEEKMEFLKAWLEFEN